MFKILKPYLNFRCALYFFSMVAGWPCVFYLMGWLPDFKISYMALVVVLAVTGTSCVNYIPSKIKNLLFIQIFIWGVYILLHGLDTSYFTRIVYLLIVLFILGMQCKNERTEYLKVYNLWTLFQVVAGAIGFILVVVGILKPIFEFAEMDNRPGYFFGLFTTNTYAGGLVRNAGFFDEPGALACWGMFALVINKLFFDDKRVEKLLTIGLVSTLSIAYYAQVAVYYFFFNKEKRCKIVLPMLVIYIALRVLANYNDDLDQAIFGRMEWDAETGTFSGNNRQVLMDRCWGQFLESPIIGVGAANLVGPIAAKLGVIAANAFFFWAADGLVGQIVVYLPLFYLFSLGKRNSKYTYAALVLLVGFLQRPYDPTQVLFPLLMFSIVLHGYYDVYGGDSQIYKNKLF